MKSIPLVALGTLLTLAVPVLAANAASSPEESASDAVVTLHAGSDLSPSREQSAALYAKALEILHTSNFNSGAPQWDWSIDKVQKKYRETVSGRYLLFVLKEPRQLATMGGAIGVREIVIGLNHPSYASALFTIDEDGRIVDHAKYAGTLCIEILQMAEEMWAAGQSSP